MTADEAAVYWVLRHDREELSAADRAAFAAWLDASEANARAFRKANGVWDVFDQADADPHLTALRQAALATPAPRRRWIPALGAGLAASLAAAALLLPGQLGLIDGPHTPAADVMAGTEAQPAAARFATAKGERRTVSLPDGTRVTLNTDTAIALAYTPGSRHVRLLRGQALFEVAKDAARPFSVEAAGRRVTALGTVFEVRLDPGRMKVVLIEGRVVVDRAAGGSELPDPAPTLLKPGQALVAELGVPQRVAPVDVGSELMWREGYVSLEDTPLAAAVAEMSRYTAAPIRVLDEETGRMRVSGVFRTGDADRFAGLVRELLPVRVERLADGSVTIARTADTASSKKSSPADVEN
ncbi:FecR domain-containing protein [Sphingomonas sp. BT-65]|uniref:FecR family protein n=1 Tax=Sphingomonas sp. BT-65 TaxID=2989821 RepID=UPI0022368FC8|nr:FecR domain-containing protein [Sphingomonas sp. BT-65]MCW4461999.1 FecR domain-containing protein [Sphingomonas sp. BT-65]